MIYHFIKTAHTYTFTRNHHLTLGTSYYDVLCDKLFEIISLYHLKRKECRIINPCSNFTDTRTHNYNYILYVYILVMSYD